MRYTIAAKPTVYNHVQFRSRLEARWAAFFDQCGWKWDYEPLDLKGWVPDFSISSPFCKILCEVKPVDIEDRSQLDSFDKAIAHFRQCQVLHLGVSPNMEKCGSIGRLCDLPDDADYSWDDVYSFLFGNGDKNGVEQMWREAGNLVQWIP